MRLLLLSTIAIAGLALTGCSAGAPAGTPSSSPPAATTSATPTASPTNTTDPATWIIDETGIGPFKLGADLTAVEATLPELTADGSVECPNPAATFLVSPSVNVTIINDAAGKIYGVEVGNEFQTPSSSIGLAHTPLSGPHTTQGVGLGSTLAELNAGASDAVQSGYQGYDPNFPSWTVKQSAASWTTFSLRTDTGTVDAIGVWPGELPPYEYCG
jgi:hypothetical protein